MRTLAHAGHENVTNAARGREHGIGNLSNDVFERRTSTGSGPFLFLNDCFAQIFSQIVTIIVKKLSNTNFISSSHIKRERASLPVDVRGSKTPLLKLTNIACVQTSEYGAGVEPYPHSAIYVSVHTIQYTVQYTNNTQVFKKIHCKLATQYFIKLTIHPSTDT